MNNNIATPTTDAALVRDLYADLEADRFDAALARVAPDVELHVPGRHPIAGNYAGHDGVATFLASSAAIVELDETVEDVLVGEHQVAALVRGRAQRADGRTLDNVTVHRYRIEDGLIREVWFHNLDQAQVDAFWA
jgi:ketosteroid isomerase-like protein